jgi:hypothetical protein
MKRRPERISQYSILGIVFSLKTFDIQNCQEIKLLLKFRKKP